MSYIYINLTSCLATGIALLVLTLLAVALRITLRWRGARKVDGRPWSNHLDDLFCLLALIPTIGVSVVLIYGAKKGIIGAHNDPSNIENWITSTTPTIVILEKLVYIIFIMQPLALGFTKLAFLFFYRRIFTWPSFQRTSLVFVILTVAFTVAFFFGFIFDCRLNFAANWGSLASIAENCPFGFQATIAFTVIDAAFDLAILVLPLPWIWRLHMPTTRKLQVCSVFLLGSFAVAAALVRMVISIKQNTPSNALNQQYIMGMPTYDIIGITSHGLFWTVVETNVALIACCLPTMRPILSIAAFGTVISSFGSFLQALGSRLNTQKSSYNSVNGNFSKISVTTTGSKRPSRDTSDVNLVEREKTDEEVRATRDPYGVFEMDREERKYFSRSSAGAEFV